MSDGEAGGVIMAILGALIWLHVSDHVSPWPLAIAVSLVLTVVTVILGLLVVPRV